MTFDTLKPKYEGPDRRCGKQRRKPIVDKTAEEVMHTEQMCQIPNLIVDREMKELYGYDVGVLYWHLKMRHKHAKVQTFFPQGRYHIMLGMTEKQLENACKTLEDNRILKRVQYEGKTGYWLYGTPPTPSTAA